MLAQLLSYATLNPSESSLRSGFPIHQPHYDGLHQNRLERVLVNSSYDPLNNIISVEVVTEDAATEMPPVWTPGEALVDERRKYVARIPAEIDLHITTPEKKGMGRSLDVSVTGILIQTLMELTWDERVIITIMHPEEDTHVCAVVTRVADIAHPEEGNKYGIKVMAEDSAVWQGALRRLIL